MNFEPRKYRTATFPDELSLEDINYFSKQIDHLLRDGKEPILIDCSGIEMIYSSGLGLFINGYKRCNEKECFFGLVNVNETIREIINATNLDKVLNIFSTIEEFEISDVEKEPKTKTPALEFNCEYAHIEKIQVITFKGIMVEGKELIDLQKKILDQKSIVCNMNELDFMEADCIPVFEAICNSTKAVLFGTSEMVKDELNLFDLIDKVKICDSQEEALLAAKTPS